MGYESLFDPLSIGDVTLRNRIMSSGHQTTLVSDHLPTEDFTAYHRARAQGGAGLIVLEAHAVDESGLLTSHTIDASRDAIVDAYEPVTEQLHDDGAAVFAQLFHGGRERYTGDYAPPAPAPSDTPTDRLKVVPRPLTTAEVREMIDSFAAAAERMERAGLDGVEIVGSHSYLPAQFWSPHLNDRTDEYGGDLENRCRFTVDIVDEIRERTSDGFAVGVRLSAEERHRRGLDFSETIPIIEHIDAACDLDYWSVVVGSSSTHRSCSYIVPPATEDHGVVEQPGEAVKELVDVPVIVTSRINEPEIGDQLIREGAADVVGMTRALIADPSLPRKVATDNRENVTPCVACNQGCIGRYQEGLPIRCTVNPETGREREFADDETVSTASAVTVVGGGPAGLVCATAAADRGHDVTLLEQADRLGGQVRHYADLSHRGAFGDWIDTLATRAANAGVDVQLETRFEPAELADAGADADADADADDSADAVVLATGAAGRVPNIPITADARVLTPGELLADPDSVRGDTVLVSDWDGNEAALDVAMACSESGRAASVELATATYSPGENVQQYVQNQLLGTLSERNVTFTPHTRVAEIGAADDTGAGTDVVLENIHSETRERRNDIDVVVFAHRGEVAYEPFREAAAQTDVPVHRVGDSWAPRSLDEAVREGYELGREL
ncbi:putative NADH-dependent flavin oxidoreductase (plasmid) [Natrialba magadii ATCC 43099]|uniref:2,4-dienoyl-CoA reductase n=1 Tax=Natrialba magadii (strain ATCC 43099 / DSM 3394 / CCM 3739 / CIP 104546 / IAM 13178 / JCM 8861 / NBRC 102185 / NCIMB 2190 / MS3) TaxID=547559 RepID=D3T1D7_NATMM|nr:FAD-dependent oxidoreductase [Natrialba magadii]ADD07396.1 putative NADH-dependent flavin oxidoreductase [Natrialba magadii ATCC 43099]ELY32420.1 2,4-dienoyl-CoA reductase [Natrialba magadii ATCC 43099]